MYDLQCPLCSAVIHSPFVRTGAVVRCAGCSGKYRIKSSHVTRNVTTGPLTLDEQDPLLTGDSVDLDPDEDASPVKIDEAGQVVGLSGLTELMRQSDAKLAKAHKPSPPPPPPGKITRPASGRSGKADAKAPPPPTLPPRPANAPSTAPANASCAPTS